MANSAGPDETARNTSRLIWIYTADIFFFFFVCEGERVNWTRAVHVF